MIDGIDNIKDRSDNQVGDSDGNAANDDDDNYDDGNGNGNDHCFGDQCMVATKTLRNTMSYLKALPPGDGYSKLDHHCSSLAPNMRQANTWSNDDL